MAGPSFSLHWEILVQTREGSGSRLISISPSARTQGHSGLPPLLANTCGNVQRSAFLHLISTPTHGDGCYETCFTHEEIEAEVAELGFGPKSFFIIPCALFKCKISLYTFSSVLFLSCAGCLMAIITEPTTWMTNPTSDSPGSNPRSIIYQLWPSASHVVVEASVSIL